MKQNYFRTLLASLSLLVSICANAYWDCIDGIYYNFSGDNAIVTCKIKFNTGNYDAYSGNVIIPSTVEYNGKTYNVTSIDEWAFFNCNQMTCVTIPSSVISIGERAFYDCSGLTNLAIPSSVTSIGNYAFDGCSNLKDIEILGDLLTVNVTASENSSSLHKAIGEDNLAKVSRLKIIGSVNGYDIMILRNKMSALKYLDMSEATIVASNYKYYNDYTTKDDVFPKYAFVDSTTPLVKVILPNSVKSVGEDAFYKCECLSFVTFGDGLQSIESSAFSGCSRLPSVAFGDGLQSIDSYAFEKCSNLRSVTFGNGLRNIGFRAFYYCSKLYSVIFGDELQCIEEGAFYGCSNLASMELGKSVKTIGPAAFYNTNLTVVKIPSSVTSIGDYAFSSSTLKDVYAYTIESTSIKQSTFSTDTYKGTLYVPKTSYYNYYYNTQWSQFQNIKEIDVEYDNFHVDGDYELDKETGVVSGEPDIEINAGAGFIIEDNTTNKQKANEVVVNVSSSTSGSIITNNNITAKTFTANITVSSNLWYFITFPFDVDLKDVTCGGSYTFA